MAGKKKEGLGAMKDTTGGKRRDDRNAVSKTSLDLISVDPKNVLTVIYLLQSPEENVVLRAVAALEGFGRKDIENLKTLYSHGIFKYLFPLIKSKDSVVKRFTLKLFGMLCKVEGFREEVLKVENILLMFNEILKSDPDGVLQEFASLVLAELSREYLAASELLKVEDSIETLFMRITSPDPDIQKNCLEIMNHLLNDVNGIEAFIECPKFDIKIILNLISSSYPVIQSLAIEVLTQLTSWCRDTRVLFAFRDALGIESILDILNKEELSDLHQGALNLLVHVSDCPELCDYLRQSGCLIKLVNLLDNIQEKTCVEKLLGVLARMSQSKRGRTALHSIEMEERFIAHLEDTYEGIQEPSCLGIANLSQYLPSLDNIMSKNTIRNLIGIVINPEKNLNLRNMAAYALNILSNEDERGPEALLQNEEYKSLLPIIYNNASLPVELCQNVIQVFIGIAHNSQFKSAVISEKLFSAFISCLPKGGASVNEDASLQVDVLECLSEYLIESEGRLVFDQLDGAGISLNCLRSKFASVREWAGHLVIIASQSRNFVKAFLQKDGLEWMLKEKNTIYSMPSWQSAIETIFANYLPAKFAYTGRLDFQDVTQDGFYIVSNPNIKFVLLDFYFEEKISPIVPVYVANLDLPMGSQVGSETPSVLKSQTSRKTEPQDLSKYMVGADRNSLEEYAWHGSLNTYSSVGYDTDMTEGCSSVNFGKYFPDVYLKEHLRNLKKKIKKEEVHFEDQSWFSVHPKLICQRARILAEFVADEMAGPEADPECNVHYKNTHITEMKYYLGTNIMPLGMIRVGDYLERAVLFKVLADRIGFPCALVRGPHGRAWIEIAVPVINVEDIPDADSNSKRESVAPTPETILSKESVRTNETINTGTKSNETDGGFWYPKLKVDFFRGFPNQLLKPNAIVDLMNQPGRILKINTFEAEEYRGAFIFAKVTNPLYCARNHSQSSSTNQT